MQRERLRRGDIDRTRLGERASAEGQRRRQTNSRRARGNAIVRAGGRDRCDCTTRAASVTMVLARPGATELLGSGVSGDRAGYPVESTDVTFGSWLAVRRCSHASSFRRSVPVSSRVQPEEPGCNEPV
jgi:hypothetical protein